MLWRCIYKNSQYKKIDWKQMIEFVDNFTWAEEEHNVWKGWTYNPIKNRYYFDDIGNESLAAFWADEFLNQAYK